MAEGIPARLTAAQGRRFGLTVGAAFAVFAGIAWWRGHPTTFTVLGALGGTAGPRRARHPDACSVRSSAAWMALAHAISKVTTPIVMGVMYLVVLTPVGLLRRSFGGNPLVHAARQAKLLAHAPGKRAALGQYVPSVLGGYRRWVCIVVELWAFMRERKKWWLLPVIAVLLVVGTLLIFAQGSALAPFIYTIF